MLRRLTILSLLFLSMESWGADYIYRPDDGLTFSWKTDDAVGITTGTTNQLKFWASSKASTTTNERELYTGGYQLNPNTTHYSYSPYKWVEEFDAHHIQCLYNKQVQSGNGSTSGLASYDYQMAKATTSSTDCTFHYQHIGGVMRISFHSPKAMTITELKVTTETRILSTSAVMDLIDQKVILDGYADVLTLTTKNISVAKDEEAIFYLSIPAQDLSSTAITISVMNNLGVETQIATLMGPNIKAGHLYEMPLTGISRSTARDFSQTRKYAPQKAAGIANPVAHSENFIIDTDYKHDVITSISPLSIDDIKNKNIDYYSLQGTKTTTPIKGKVYIHKGKKTIFN